VSTTLLAVDDSKTMRKVLEITFAGEDYRTVLAGSADEAIALLRSENPSVALVDAGLGTSSGYDLCQQIKAQAPGTAVLLLSSKQQPYDRNRGSAVGADDFMDKPFDTQQLIDKVKALAKNAAAGAVAVASAPAVSAPAVSAPAVSAPAVSAPAVSAPAAAAARVAPTPEPMRSPTLAYGSPADAAPQRPVAPARPVAPRAHATSPGLAPSPEPPRAAPAAAVSQTARAVSHATDNGAFAGKLSDLGLSSDQVEAVLALSREVVERVVWEVVPTLAEALIKEEIQRLTND